MTKTQNKISYMIKIAVSSINNIRKEDHIVLTVKLEWELRSYFTNACKKLTSFPS